MMNHEQSDRIPLSEAALELRMSRDKLIRRIQQGAIAGGKSLGSWYVERGSLAAEAHRQALALAEPSNELEHATHRQALALAEPSNELEHATRRCAQDSAVIALAVADEAKA